jgi:WD40 repeat protein
MANISFTRIVSSRSQVECLAFSPVKDCLAACFSDGSVRLYLLSYAHGENLIITESYCCKSHTSNVWCVSFSKDGSLLSSCSSDQSLVIYTVNPFRAERTITNHSGTIWCCKFCNVSTISDTLIASAGEDCSVQISSAISGELYVKLPLLQSPVECLDFSSDGEVLATVSKHGEVSLWTNITTEPQCHLIASDLKSRFCRFISWDGSDKKLLVTSNIKDHSLVLFKCELSQRTDDSGMVFKLEGHCNIVWACCMISENHLVTCSSDRTIRFWNLQSRSCLLTLQSIGGDSIPNPQILSCDFCNLTTKDGAILAMAMYDGSIYIANIRNFML